MSFVQGFNSGFGLVNNAYNQIQQRERQAMLDERENERYQAEQEWRKQQAEQTQQNADRAFGLQYDEFEANRKRQAWQEAKDEWNRDVDLEQREIENARADKELKIQEENARHNRKASSRQIELQEQEAKRSEEKSKREADKHKYETMDARNKEATKIMQMWATGADITDADKEIIQNSYLAGTYNAFKGSLEDANQHFAQYQNLRTPDDVYAFLNDPKTLKYAKGVFNNEVYRREKATGDDYEIIALEPVNGGITPVFKITKQDGSVVVAPATKNRSSDKSDQLSVVSWNDMKNKTLEALTFANHVESNPKLKALFSGSTGKDDYIKIGEKDTLINAKTGKVAAQGIGLQAGGMQGSGMSADQKRAFDAARELLVTTDNGMFKKFVSPEQLSPADKQRFYALLQQSGATLSDVEKSFAEGKQPQETESVDPNNPLGLVR